MKYINKTMIILRLYNITLFFPNITYLHNLYAHSYTLTNQYIHIFIHTPIFCFRRKWATANWPTNYFSYHYKSL